MARLGWLSAPLVVLMAAISCYEVIRFSVASATGRPIERDVDGFHLAMGVTMAALLAGRLSPFTDEAAAVLFAAATVWFAARVPSAIAVHAVAPPSLAHRLSHVVASAEMVFMLLVMRPIDDRAGMAAMDPASAHGPAMLGVVAILAALAAVSAVAHLGSTSGGPEASLTGSGASGSDEASTSLDGAALDRAALDYSAHDDAAHDDAAHDDAAHDDAAHDDAAHATRHASASWGPVATTTLWPPVRLSPSELLWPRLATAVEVVMGLAMAAMLVAML